MKCICPKCVPIIERLTTEQFLLTHKNALVLYSLTRDRGKLTTKLASQILSLSIQTISNELHLLEKFGILTSVKQGRQRFYSIRE
jgi:DNA-binding transcriptional ArsR family regulator